MQELINIATGKVICQGSISDVESFKTSNNINESQVAYRNWLTNKTF